MARIKEFFTRSKKISVTIEVENNVPRVTKVFLRHKGGRETEVGQEMQDLKIVYCRHCKRYLVTNGEELLLQINFRCTQAIQAVVNDC